MKETKEIWMPFDECPHFIISNTGRLINTNTNHERKLSKQKSNYLGFTLFRGTKSYRMHDCVARHFLDKPDSIERLQVNHIDFDITNNHDWNLEWVTAKQNMQHSVINNRIPKGSKRVGSKLDELSAIVALEAKSNGFTYKDIATYFKVSQTAIYNINKGRNWKHINIK